MRTEFVTKGFEKTEAMDAFLQHSTLDSVDQLLKRENDVHLRVVVDEDSHRNQTRKPSFTCEIVLKTGASKRLFKVRKQAANFRTAVMQASKAMKAILRKRSEKRHVNKHVDQRTYIENQRREWAVRRAFEAAA